MAKKVDEVNKRILEMLSERKVKRGDIPLVEKILNKNRPPPLPKLKGL
ncbi:hypothetical protein LCGC14_0965020 [marine sediment metagenome]|uniref:Uncharacterized protein n=1 Tax=marine sediment metagenome TaxID=412755 RepID=A0A0F9NZG5_9ZZZZ